MPSRELREPAIALRGSGERSALLVVLACSHRRGLGLSAPARMQRRALNTNGRNGTIENRGPAPAPHCGGSRRDRGTLAHPVPRRVGNVRHSLRAQERAPAPEAAPTCLGSGVAMLDYDGDGWLDLYFATARDLPLSAAAAVRSGTEPPPTGLGLLLFDRGTEPPPTGLGLLLFDRGTEPPPTGVGTAPGSGAGTTPLAGSVPSYTADCSSGNRLYRNRRRRNLRGVPTSRALDSRASITESRWRTLT